MEIEIKQDMVGELMWLHIKRWIVILGVFVCVNQVDLLMTGSADRSIDLSILHWTEFRSQRWSGLWSWLAACWTLTDADTYNVQMNVVLSRMVKLNYSRDQRWVRPDTCQVSLNAPPPPCSESSPAPEEDHYPEQFLNSLLPVYQPELNVI